MPANGIDTRAIRLDSMRGNEHVKRAIEVAAVQNHAVVFATHRANRITAENYAQWMRAMYGNMNVFVLEPCYCGNYGDVYRQCKCSERAIARWRNRDEYKQAMQAAEMWVEVAYVSFEKLASAHKPESDETIMRRVNAGQAYWKKPMQLSEMDGASQRLMAAAMNQLMLSESQVQQVLSVTASIVALNEGRSSVSCLAEALQYRIRQL